MRGVINVVSAQPQTLTAVVTSNSYAGNYSLFSSKKLF